MSTQQNISVAASILFICDRAPLISWLFSRITDEDIKSIAGLDYGIDFDDHVTKLTRVRRLGLEGFALDGYLVEVLNLAAWSEPSSDADTIGIHRQRAFSCSLAYGSGAAPSDRYYTDESTLIQFVESLIALDAPRTAAIQFLAWLLSDVDEGDSEPVFIGLALLYFALHEKRCASDEILSLIDRIMSLGDAADMASSNGYSACSWRLINGRGIFIDKWRRLVESISESVPTRHGIRIKEDVALLVSMILAVD